MKSNFVKIIFAQEWLLPVSSKVFVKVFFLFFYFFSSANDKVSKRKVFSAETYLKLEYINHVTLHGLDCNVLKPLHWRNPKLSWHVRKKCKDWCNRSSFVPYIRFQIKVSCSIGHRAGSEQMLPWLWCRPAGSSSSDLTPSLGISICHRCGPKKEKKEKRKRN